ncbi:MAG: hypothetical protein U0326_21140 [Polyangiales bacterium]
MRILAATTHRPRARVHRRSFRGASSSASTSSVWRFPRCVSGGATSAARGLLSSSATARRTLADLADLPKTPSSG